MSTLEEILFPAVRSDVVERFTEAVVSGRACRTARAGPRRYAALSLNGLEELGDLHGYPNIAPEAFRSIVGLTAHPRAQQRFLHTWSRLRFGPLLREWVGDDELYIAGLRTLLPPYTGPAMALYRGQRATEAIGLSWADNVALAHRFALYGCGKALRSDGVVLCGHAMPDAIISAPCQHVGGTVGEYVCDPRRVRIVHQVELGAT